MLKKPYQTVKHKNSIQRIIKTGSKLSNQSYTLFVASQDSPNLGAAFIAPKRIGKAVERNLAKRRLRSAFRNLFKEYNILNKEFIIMANGNTIKQKFAYIESNMLNNFKLARLIDAQ